MMIVITTAAEQATGATVPCNDMNWATIQEQHIRHEDVLRDMKGIALTAYEDTRDLIAYTKMLQNMVQDLIERDIQMTTHILQLTRLTENIDIYLPNYATQTNSKLHSLDQRQDRMENLVHAMNGRLIRQDSLIVESAKLSQAAIITYSIITILSVLLISFGIMLFLSYFASSASADTPYIQRVAKTVFSMIPLSMINGRMVTEMPRTVPTVTELPPSYSTVHLDQI